MTPSFDELARQFDGSLHTRKHASKTTEGKTVIHRSREYPIVETSPPTSPSSEVRRRMRRQKTSGTRCEIAVRKILHRRGVRFRVDFQPNPALRTRVDIGWKNIRLAVFIDGCFWHKCPDHFVAPKTNTEWWEAKLNANTERDARITHQLAEQGWEVLRFWEHEDPRHIASEITRLRDERSGEAITSR
ncbi:very short patch repair endonuclease [Dietzia sp. B44]|uniref:very short patch repair endonuclease n=1 Tax=Dietzia sp. B44 TaxID=1630633 RepID=UPI00321FD717